MINSLFSYDRNAKILTATYDSGSAFELFDVPPALYDEMSCAQSEVDFFNKRIWNRFEYSSLHHSVETLLAYIADNIVGFPENRKLTVDSRTFEKDTPLHITCIWGDLQAVELLIKAGSELEAKNDMGFTPLHFAESYGHRRCVHKLLLAGARPVDVLP